jgi:hypothetical protein
MHPSSEQSYFFSKNLSEAEFMQYLRPVGGGPSSKTWPKCPPHFEHSTSVLAMPSDPSFSIFMAFFETGEKKLGQPLMELNFSPELNRGASQAAQTYLPSFLLFQYKPQKGGSVPFCRSTLYCSGVSFRFHSSSVLGVLLGISTIRLLAAKTLKSTKKRPNFLHI